MKSREIIVCLMICGLFAILAAACGSKKDSNSNNNALANVNSSNAGSSANASPQKADAITSAPQDEKIKPDANAKIENGKKMPPVLDMNIILPADWKHRKEAYSTSFTPPKLTEDGISGVYVRTESLKESEFPVNDKRAMLESELKGIKQRKERGEIQYSGTLPIFSDAQGVIMGFSSLRENAASDAKPNKKCDVENVPNCGLYGWRGYYGGKYHDSYFIGIVFPPGTYEKNKPMIDAILTSIKFK